MILFFTILLKICFYTAFSPDCISTLEHNNALQVKSLNTIQTGTLFIDTIESECEEKSESSDQESGNSFHSYNIFQVKVENILGAELGRKSVHISIKKSILRYILFCSMLE